MTMERPRPRVKRPGCLYNAVTLPENVTQSEGLESFADVFAANRLEMAGIRVSRFNPHASAKSGNFGVPQVQVLHVLRLRSDRCGEVANAVGSSASILGLPVWPKSCNGGTGERCEKPHIVARMEIAPGRLSVRPSPEK
jgi:hypothetical protein